MKNHNISNIKALTFKKNYKFFFSPFNKCGVLRSMKPYYQLRNPYRDF